ncbi:MAG: oligosaccharide flippase family protein [Chitinophagales bacterium]
MSVLKKLLGQTALYGLSTMLGRFLNYLLVRVHTGAFAPAEFGVVSELYSYSGFLTVLLAFGMETGYFRFARKGENPKVYSTILIFLLSSSAFFFTLVTLLSPTLGRVLHYEGKEYYFIWLALFLAFDAIGAIAFSRLRNEDKAARFVTIKLTEIGISIALNIFFIMLAKPAYESGSNSWLAKCYSPSIGVGYVFLSNLIASGIKLLMLSPLFFHIKFVFDKEIFGKLIRYSLPMIPIGLAGIVNETLDRPMLKFLLPFDPKTNMEQMGIYSACYKISIVMTLFIQAYRYAAEPFFFKQAEKENSRQIFAEVMNFFVIFCCAIFLLVTLFLDYFKYFLGSTAYYEGLKIVPILLMANLCLGVYVNLSVWYKLTDRTGMGAWVSIGGAVITLLLNFALIPVYGYMGSAVATFICYFSMSLISYLLGRKYYPVPYDVSRLIFYVLFAIGLYLLSTQVQFTLFGFPVLSVALLFGFVAVAVLMNRKKWKSLRVH